MACFLVVAAAAVLLFMLTYLVLFAALAVKMRSSTFLEMSFKIRVEARQIPGQAFYFLYSMGWGGSLSLSPAGNIINAELRGQFSMVTSNRWCKRAPAYVAPSHILNIVIFLFACVNIGNLELSKLEIYNPFLSLRPVSFTVTEYCQLASLLLSLGIEIIHSILRNILRK